VQNKLQNLPKMSPAVKLTNLMTCASSWVKFRSFSTRQGVKLSSTSEPELAEAAFNNQSFGNEHDRGADSRPALHSHT
jgi:hypothetical protein